MKYIEVKIKTSKSGIDAVLAALMNIGINDAMIDDPDEILAMIASPGPSEWYDESQIPDVSLSLRLLFSFQTMRKVMAEQMM